MHVELSFLKTKYTLPILAGTEGERAIDLTSLRATTGLVGFDPGFQNTAACRSAITFVDGERGILRYRGYPIESLVGNVPFLDVAQLLIRGELPSAEQSREFAQAVNTSRLDHAQWTTFFNAVPANAPPMAILSSGINMMSMYFPRYFVDDGSPATFEEMTARLFASMMTIAVLSYKKSRGEPFMFPEQETDYASQFLNMMFGGSGDSPAAGVEAKRLLDALLVIHSDHEQNCSTSTVRLVGSSRVNLYSSVCAGICALWGPLHGGANQRVIEMLEQILAEQLSVREVVERVCAGQFRLSGFGHRVYKTYDPRARILKTLASKYLSHAAGNDRHLETALALEEAALSHPYFQERQLYPNLDFYSGILYRALGIPADMFPVMFAMGRLPGWIAHWKEMHDTTPFKIGRPRQLYVGCGLRQLPAIQ